MTLVYFELDDESKNIPKNALASFVHYCRQYNPDFKELYWSVARWYVEADLHSKRVVREVGLDEMGQPVVLGPFGRNDGLWTSLPNSIFAVHHVERYAKVNKQTFESHWTALSTQYAGKIPPKRRAPRVLVSKNEQLVGLWSSDILAGVGNSSWQEIAFLPNGSGYFGDYNWALMYYHSFEWEIPKDGFVMIRGGVCHDRDENGKLTEYPSDLDCPLVRAETQTHYGSDGSSIDVLYLPLRKDRPWISEAYGRLDIPASEIQFPEFT